MLVYVVSRHQTDFQHTILRFTISELAVPHFTRALTHDIGGLG